MTRAESIDVPYETSFSMEDPWQVPKGASTLDLVRSTDGLAPRLSTQCSLFYDPQALRIIFEGSDLEVVATHRKHDAPLYEEDVFEAFLSPRAESEYFEIEVNPLGTLFDARILSPDGVRTTMQTDLAWSCHGCWAAVRREVDESAIRISASLSIPFSGLGEPAPSDGDQWRANFYRIDRSAAGDEFTAWRPTFRIPADFHLPSAFGTLHFRR